MAGSSIPLLNHYKKEFVTKRLPQTFLGGLILKLGYSAPCYVYLCQIIIWLLPFVIGGCFTIAVEVGGLLPLHACIGNGLIVGVITLLLQIASKVVAKIDVDADTHSLSSSTSANSKQLRRLLAEDDEVVFDSCLSSTTYLFIIPPKKYYATIVIASLISVFVNGLGLWYCLPNTTFTLLHGYTTVGSIFLFIFSWIVICIAHYPLLLGNPVPETASYRSVDLYETQNMWRALTVSLFLCSFLVDIIVDSTILTDVNNVLHIIFCILPLLWLFGIIPPVDALLLWAMEQFLVFGLGGSCMSTDWRLLFMTVVSSSLFVGLSFATSTQLLISCSVGFGYIFSTDITSIFFIVLSRLKKLSTCCGGSETKVEEFDKTDNSSIEKAPKKQISWKEVLTHAVLFSLVFGGTFVAHFYSSAVSGNLDLKSALDYVFITIFVIAILCREIQRVYVFFGIFRNYVYPLSTLSQTQFQKRKKILRIFGVLHGVFLHVIFPLLSSIYLSFFMFSSATVLPSIEVALSCIHGLRFVWQRPGNALFSFTVLSIFNLIPTLSSSTWGSIFVGTRLLIIDISRDRLFLFLDNLWFAFTVTVTSWTNKKQRRSSSVLLICLNAIFFPVTLVIIATASVLSAPLLPLFTLPIFLIGFPRPNKFWPAQPGSVQGNVCSDTVYYQQLIGPISQWFSSEIGLGIVSTQASLRTLQPFYIARSQDRTMWIQVLESGCGYTSFSIKGLELQETSCHSLEATRLDDAFDIAFEKTELDLRCMRTNQYAGTSSVTPVDSAFLESYSDAKNSLRGIVDHPDVIKQLRADFLKALCWVLTQNILSSKKSVLKLQQNGLNSVSNNQINSVTRELSVQDLQETTNHPNSVPDSDNSGDACSRIIHTPRSDSVVSFQSLLSSDDERSVSRIRRKKRRNGGKDIEMTQRLSALSGKSQNKQRNRKDTEVDEWSVDSILSDSGYGLPAVDANMKKTDKIQTKQLNGYGASNGLRESYIHLVTDKNLNAEDEKLFCQLIPPKWNEIPVSAADLSQSREVMDANWLEHCFKLAVEKNSVAATLTPSIATTLMNLVLSCDAIVNVIGVPGKDSSLLGSEHIYHVFSDNIPWSPALDWLKERKDLHKMVLMAYRYAVKLMYDQTSLGPAENYDELAEYFTEYNEDWYIGLESDKEWNKSLVDGNLHLFAIGYSAAKEMSARVLTKQSISIHLGRVNPAAVRGIWSNFALELIYATNDDEERYSIQAHLPLLRNLLTQTADPPLGYPIYSSPSISQSTLHFK